MQDIRKLDEIDRKILAAVAQDGRISVVALADAVGISKSPAQVRLKRLEAEGYILGYRATLNAQALGQSHIAFVEVRLSDTTEPSLAAFNAAVRKTPEIEECHMIAGPFDYLLKVRSRDVHSYRRILAERISTLPHVSSSSTHIAMETVKDAAF